VIRSLEGRRLRANPEYELVLFDRLSAKERRTLAALERAPDLYGILRPRTPGLGAKSVSREAALLFFALADAGLLPRYLDAALGPERDRVVGRLVMDGVLEVEVSDRFLSGPPAYAALGSEGEGEGEGDDAGPVARISIEAMRYAAGLLVDDPLVLANRLYLYNRLPLSRRWTSAFGSEAKVARVLGIDRDGAHAGVLADHWRSASEASSAWHVWTRHAAADGVAGRLSHKLYVSPHSGWIGPAFAATLDVLTGSEAVSFKVGRNVVGLLRPDKLVAYFVSREALEAAAGQLRSRLSGMPAHGVPFTAELDEHGLLSWGMDPPRGYEAIPSERRSWRAWVTGRLAVSLLQARRSEEGSLEPWRFALDRLVLEGIDRSTWSPLEVGWA
jgi:hypothetical protein